MLRIKTPQGQILRRASRIDRANLIYTLVSSLIYVKMEAVFMRYALPRFLVSP